MTLLKNIFKTKQQETNQTDEITYEVPSAFKEEAPLKRAQYELIPEGTYDARVVRVISLGMHPQKKSYGERPDVFRIAVSFELVGVNVGGVGIDGIPFTDKPACTFRDYYVQPGARRGVCYDFCKTVDPSIKSTPSDLNWFSTLVNKPLKVKIGSYTDYKGVKRNTLLELIPFEDDTIKPARTELVWFNCYEESDKMKNIYETKLFSFQSRLLAEAKDSKSIPYSGKSIKSVMR